MKTDWISCRWRLSPFLVSLLRVWLLAVPLPPPSPHTHTQLATGQVFLHGAAGRYNITQRRMILIYIAFSGTRTVTSSQNGLRIEKALLLHGEETSALRQHQRFLVWPKNIQPNSPKTKTAPGAGRAMTQPESQPIWRPIHVLGIISLL